MDPTETLRELRARIELAERNTKDEDNVARIVELFKALDTWISRGGFYPNQWPNHSTGRGGW